MVNNVPLYLLIFALQQEMDLSWSKQHSRHIFMCINDKLELQLWPNVSVWKLDIKWMQYSSKYTFLIKAIPTFLALSY